MNFSVLRASRSVVALFFLLACAVTPCQGASCNIGHVGEIALPILWFPNPEPPAAPAQVPINLNGGVSVLMEFQRPDGSLVTDTMTVEGTGTGNCADAATPTGYTGPCASYSTVAGDFTIAGDYVFQWFIKSGTSLLRIGDQLTCYVGPTL